MTDEPYADDHAGSAHPDPELRAALGTLLADEPPAPPVVDDLARGRAVQRRHRARAGAIVGLAAVVVGLVALGASLRPGSTVAPPAQGTTPATAMADRLGPALATMGWAVTGAEAVTSAERPEIRLTLAKVADPGATAQLWVLGSGADDRVTAPYFADCTETTCPGVRAMAIADGFTPAGGHEDRGATSGSLDPPGPGARILDREYGTGSLVELVSVPGADVGPTWTPAPGPSPESASAPGVLSFDELSRLLTVVGDPLRPTPRPAPSAAEHAPACRDLDVKLTPASATAAATGELAMAIAVDARNPEVRCTLTGAPQVQVLGAGGAVLPTTMLQAGAVGNPSTVPVAQPASPSARAVLSWSPCSTGTDAAATALRVTLPGDDAPITVELPQGLGPSACGGVDAIAIRVRPFEAAAPSEPDPMGSTTPLPVPTGTSAALTTGLRGVPAASALCPALPDKEIDALVAITGEVTRLWVCSASTYEPVPERRTPPQPVVPSDGREFDTFLRELEAPDGPPPAEGTVCRAMFQGPRSVVVETTDGTWLAHLPRDSCRLFSAGLSAALGRASR